VTSGVHDGWRVRVVGPEGKSCGAGVLVAPELVLTCAHVVALALRSPASGRCPRGPLTVEFATAADEGQIHGVVLEDSWIPAAEDHSGDLALVKLERAVAVEPAVLAPCGPPSRRQVKVFGHPTRQPMGVWASAVIVGTAGPTGEWVQLTDPHGAGHRIEPGFSGAGVIDENVGRVIGVVVVSDRDASVKGAWMIAIEAAAVRLPRLRSLLAEGEPLPGDTGGRADAARLNYEVALVDALSALDGIANREQRDNLVREVERRIGASLLFDRTNWLRTDLRNLVVACMDYRTGNILLHLVAAVASLHDNAPVVQQLHQLHAQDPHRRLTADDVDRLVALLGQLPRNRIGEAATVAFGQIGPTRDVNPQDPAALVRALSELVGDAEALPPLLLFLQLLADDSDTTASAAEALREWVVLLATRWQIRLADRRAAKDIEAVAAPTRSYLVVVLREDPPAPDRYLLSIWLQHETDSGVRGFGVFTDDEQPLTIDEVVGYVGIHLRRVIAENLGPVGSLTIEFVLPHWLLTYPVDQFRLIVEGQPQTLGAAYPVVVRSLNRLQNDLIHHRWRARWRHLKANQHRVDPRASKWVRPQGTGPRTVEDELKRDPSGYSEEYPSCLGLLTPRRTERLFAIIQEALELGMPVLLWCRLNRITDQFLVEMANQMNGRPVSEVSAVIQRFRYEAALLDSAADHLGSHIGLLWDDADRLPPKGFFRAPA